MTTTTIVGVVRVRLAELADCPKGAAGVTLEVDIGPGWPDNGDLSTLTGLGVRFDRVVLVGSDAHALAYCVNYMRERFAVLEHEPVPEPTPF